jgi:hypothetical protein
METLKLLILTGFRIYNIGHYPVEQEAKKLHEYEVMLFRSALHHEDEKVTLRIRTEICLEKELRVLINNQ